MSLNPINKKEQREDHQTMSEVLQEFVRKNRLEKGLDKVNVEEAWNRELGPAIEKYTAGIKLQRGTLYVHLTNSVLREELGYGKEKIIKLLNEALKKDLIKKLVLR